jgi:hypothetical protein
VSISKIDITPAEWDRLKAGDEQLEVMTSHAEFPLINVWDLAGMGHRLQRERIIAALDAGEQEVEAMTGGWMICLISVRDDLRWVPDSYKKPSFDPERRWRRIPQGLRELHAERWGAPA